MTSTILADYCDYSPKEPWPIGWESSFGKYKFFYVAGVAEGFWKRRIVVPDNIAASLAEMGINQVCDLEREWLSVYPGPACADGEPVPSDWDLHEVGYGILQRVGAYRPISFPKAMLVVRNLLSIAEASGDSPIDPRQLQIRLANSYIQSLGLVLAELSSFKREALYNALGGQHMKSLVSEMKRGYPVTQQFALHVASTIRQLDGLSEEARNALAVLKYEDRARVRASIKALSSTSKNDDTMRVAAGETPIAIEATSSPTV